MSSDALNTVAIATSSAVTSSVVEVSVTQLGQGNELLSPEPAPGGCEAPGRQSPGSPSGGVQLVAKQHLLQPEPERHIERLVAEGVERLLEEERLPTGVGHPRHGTGIERAIEGRTFIQHTGDVQLDHRDEAFLAPPAVL